MKKGKLVFYYTFLVIAIGLLASSFNKLYAQEASPYVRIASIVVDSLQLNDYKAALKEHAEAAVAKEPGVLTLYAVYSKEQPTHVTVFEIYANVPSYHSHILTTHFLKYKNSVKDMVKSLVLTDVVPIALEAKSKI